MTENRPVIKMWQAMQLTKKMLRETLMASSMLVMP
jgi:hypothetical protein